MVTSADRIFLGVLGSLVVTTLVAWGLYAFSLALAETGHDRLSAVTAVASVLFVSVYAVFLFGCFVYLVIGWL